MIFIGKVGDKTDGATVPDTGAECVAHNGYNSGIAVIVSIIRKHSLLLSFSLQLFFFIAFYIMILIKDIDNLKDSSIMHLIVEYRGIPSFMRPYPRKSPD